MATTNKERPRKGPLEFPRNARWEDRVRAADGRPQGQRAYLLALDADRVSGLAVHRVVADLQCGFVHA
jgi:hypothetical protein